MRQGARQEYNKKERLIRKMRQRERNSSVE